MPFNQPFRPAFFPRDLIYGLGESRAVYARRSPRFPGRALSLDNDGCPYYVDHLLLPHQLRIHIAYDGNYLCEHELRWGNSDLQEKFVDFLEHSGCAKYRRLADYDLPHPFDIDDEEGDSDDERPLPVLGDPRIKLLSRKCKAALAWMTSGRIGHIHFILDGIDVDAVIDKRPAGGRSVTACELRWIYRNRFKTEVQEGIQFWRHGSPVSPPWESDRVAWGRYRPAHAGQ